MCAQKVHGTVSCKSENFSQTLEESVLDSTEMNSSLCYGELISANERLKMSLSRIFTEFVNKARLEQGSNGNEKKRKNKEEEEEDDGVDNEDDADDDDESSENNDDE